MAEWTKSPEAALKYFLSLSFEEQIALEYVITWHRQKVQEQAAGMYEQLKSEYAAAVVKTAKQLVDESLRERDV